MVIIATFLVLLVPLVNIWYNDSYIQSILLFIAICIISSTISYSVLNDDNKDNKDDKDDNDNKDDKDDNDNKVKEKAEDKYVYAFLAISLAGLIAYGINYYEGIPCTESNSELLCNSSFIIIFILFNFAVYTIIKLCRKDGLIMFNKDSSFSENNDITMFTIGVIFMWQLYIYLLADGFKGKKKFGLGNWMKKDNYTGGEGNQETIYKIFSFMSVFVLTGLIITNLITSKRCKLNDN